MAFSGWPAEAIEFYEGLAADNSKHYWQAHKAVYDELVHQPMTELLAELEAEFGAGKIFRPYRDIRFSRDKSPYKTAIGATLASGGYVAVLRGRTERGLRQVPAESRAVGSLPARCRRRRERSRR